MKRQRLVVTTLASLLSLLLIALLGLDTSRGGRAEQGCADPVISRSDAYHHYRAAAGRPAERRRCAPGRGEL